jgi:hypothetical protein
MGKPGHRRVAMGHINRLSPNLGPSREQAAAPNRVQSWAKSRPDTMHPIFSFFNFVYIFRNSIKILTYLENTIKLGKNEINFIRILLSRSLQYA